MKEQLQLLARLKEIDDQIDYHDGNLTRLPLEVQEIARNLVVLRREIAEAKERLEDLEKDLRHKERDLAVEQEKIKRSEKRLMSIKNQKEYNALSRQVKLGKKVVGEIEEAMLERMSQVENLNKILVKKDKDYADLEETLKGKKALADKTAGEAKEALVSLNAEKEKIAEGLDREHLKKYETVRKALGVAVAEMENGSCSQCHMIIPPQLNIRVLKQEEIIYCPSCQRILYVRPENIPEFNKMDA